MQRIKNSSNCDGDAGAWTQLDALRAAIAAGLDSGEPLPEEEVFRRLEAKYDAGEGD